MSASTSASSSSSAAVAAAPASTTASRKRTHALVQSTITMHATPTAETKPSAAAAAADPVPAKRSRKTASSSSAVRPASSSAAAAAADSSFWTYCPSVIPAVPASSSADGTSVPARSASAECDRFYSQLRALVNPVPGVIFVYGKHHEERRLTGVYARTAGDFSYSGKTSEASGVWPPVLEELHTIAVREASRVQRNREQQASQGHSAEDDGEESKEGSAAAVSSSAAAAPAASSSAAAAAAASPPASPSSSPSPAFHWDTVLINFYRDGSDSISWHSDKDCQDSTIASFSFGVEREFFIRQRPPPGSGGSTKSLRTWSQSLGNGSLLLMHPGMQSRFHHSLPARKSVTRGRINVTFRSNGRVAPASGSVEGGSVAAAAGAAMPSPKHVRG